MTQYRSSHSRRLKIGSGRQLPLFGALLTIGLISSAHAEDHGDKAARKAQELASIRAAVARGELAPLPRIMALAQARVPGDVVKTELETEHGRLTYEVKILTSTGRVREVKLDARTGGILLVEDD